MPAHYREREAPTALSRWVECVWSLESPEALRGWPVRPDGCIDILYSRVSGLQLVGAMTAPRRFDMPAGERTIGMRFRPGMAGSLCDLAPSELTDRTIGFSDGRLEERLQGASTADEAARLLVESLSIPPRPPNPVQLAIEAMAGVHGNADLDWIADQANLSPRQFRRRCLEESGLTPRRLCRVLRFRYAGALAAGTSKPEWAEIAADAGYFDQAHLIRDFREFAGETPVAVFSNTEADATG